MDGLLALLMYDLGYDSFIPRFKVDTMVLSTLNSLSLLLIFWLGSRGNGRSVPEDRIWTRRIEFPTIRLPRRFCLSRAQQGNMARGSVDVLSHTVRSKQFPFLGLKYWASKAGHV